MDSVLSNDTIGKYVFKSMLKCLEEEIRQNALFKAVRGNSTDSGLLSDALKLWTTTRLFMEGWEVAEATSITDPESTCFNGKPASRVLGNELDLELLKTC